jgi:hypothetical protein
MLYERKEYTADISYLTNVYITEYDLSKANINVLRTKGVLDQQTYDYLYNAERMVRQVYVGKLQRDQRVGKILSDGIVEAKKMLFESNGLLDRDILSIKNDAVFVISKKLNVTDFGLLHFAAKNTYTSFYKFMNYEFFYYYNSITSEERLDVKGINDETLKLHSCFLSLIKDIMFMIQINGPEVAMRILKDYYLDYINLRLEIGYYRNFNSESDFKYNFVTMTGSTYSIKNAAEDMDKRLLDISYNAMILAQFQKIIASMYFNKNR